MNNQQNPACRDAFIAAMTRQTGSVRKLKWHPIDRDAMDGEWEWDDQRTEDAYRGWCLLWKPPSDVDPESILGKLTAFVIECELVGLESHMAVTPDVSFADLFDLIETLQQRVKELEDTIDAHRHAVMDNAIQAAKERTNET